MGKKNDMGLILLLGLLLVGGYFLLSGGLKGTQISPMILLGTETLTRTMPLLSTVNGMKIVNEGATFQNTYTASGGNIGSSKFFVSITDTPSGGCVWSNGLSNFVMQGEIGDSPTLNKMAVAPVTRNATCTFTGNYQFGSFAVTNILSPPSTNQVKVCTVSSETCNDADEDCDGVIDNGMTGPYNCVQLGVCAGAIKTCMAGVLSVCSKLPTTEVCDNYLDDDCNGASLMSNTGADAQVEFTLTYCDSLVSREELSAFALKWIGGTVTREALGLSAAVWIGA